MNIAEHAAGHFAEWVRAERAANGWSLAQLAADMTEGGCRMDGSAVSRIESGKRQVSVTEAFVFSRLIGRPLGVVVRPRSLVTNKEANRLLQWHAELERQIRGLRAQQQLIEQQLVDLGDGSDAAGDVLAGMQAAGLTAETAADLLARFRAKDPRRAPTLADFFAQPSYDEEEAEDA